MEAENPGNSRTDATFRMYPLGFRQSLAGWSIANRNKAKAPLAGVIKAGATAVFGLPVDVPLSNDGGLITLLDASGLKVHGVAYTKAQVARQGWSVTF